MITRRQFLVSASVATASLPLAFQTPQETPETLKAKIIEAMNCCPFQPPIEPPCPWCAQPSGHWVITFLEC